MDDGMVCLSWIDGLIKIELAQKFVSSCDTSEKWCERKKRQPFCAGFHNDSDIFDSHFKTRKILLIERTFKRISLL